MLIRSALRSTVLNAIGTFKSPKPGVFILNSHYVSAFHSSPQVFRSFIDFLKSFSILIDFELAVKMITERRRVNATYIAFTFDDGFIDCYEPVSTILHENNVSGCFFINPCVLESNSGASLSSFKSRIDHFDKRFVCWGMVEEMIAMNHTIGSHSFSHRFAGIMSLDEFAFDVKLSNRILSERLRRTIDYYAWPYGSLSSIRPEQVDFVKTVHPYIFSSVRSRFYQSFNDRVINRIHIEPDWPKSHIKYFLSHEKVYFS
jgi:peptidoglycan/xylan/chitin deacetylase (PgdA/CDA1 family)